jgi:hypothetical protein
VLALIGICVAVHVSAFLLTDAISSLLINGRSSRSAGSGQFDLAISASRR